MKSKKNKTMSKKINASSSNTFGGFSALVAFLAMAVCLAIGIVIYSQFFGDPANFENGDPNGHPLEGNLLGTIYKGGFTVPGLVAINLIILVFSFERLVTLLLANGKGKPARFIKQIKTHLSNGDYTSAIKACDKQKGSLANVVRAGMVKSQFLESDTSLDKEQKVEALKKEMEEATALELPMLSKNLSVLSTCATIATLVGLIGTVLGMIRSFAAMSSGAPDTAQLSTGISEALINTAFGITASTIAIIMYNVFSTQIDSMTYSIDEANFTIVHDFSVKA